VLLKITRAQLRSHPVDGHRYYPKVQTALQDAQRTLGLVRQHAAQWHVIRNKIA